jgi:hypothetical protein
MDALMLDQIRQGKIDLREKLDGKDFFDYAVSGGSITLMTGLLPYIQRSGRTILALEQGRESSAGGLFIDALNALNSSAAYALSTVMNRTFTARDEAGQEYSLIYNAYDSEAIISSARRMQYNSRYNTGTGETKRYTEEEIRRLREEEFSSEDYQNRVSRFQDRQGRWFVEDTAKGNVLPAPQEEYKWLYFFENGYYYSSQSDYRRGFSITVINVCFFENSRLRRKLVLAFPSIGAFALRNNKIYNGDNRYAYIIDLNTARVTSAFTATIPGRYDTTVWNIYPTGTGDEVSTFSLYVGDH